MGPFFPCFLTGASLRATYTRSLPGWGGGVYSSSGPCQAAGNHCHRSGRKYLPVAHVTRDSHRRLLVPEGGSKTSHLIGIFSSLFYYLTQDTSDWRSVDWLSDSRCRPSWQRSVLVRGSHQDLSEPALPTCSTVWAIRKVACAAREPPRLLWQLIALYGARFWLLAFRVKI